MKRKSVRKTTRKPRQIILFYIHKLDLVVPISALLAAIHYWLK